MGIIRNLLRRIEQTPLPAGMVDIHCHILPGIDDGPGRMKDSIAMAKVAVDDGITEIIATPHLNAVLNDPSRVMTVVGHLNQVLIDRKMPIVLHPGAEVSVIVDPARISAFTMNNGSWLLLEFCHARLPMNAGDLVRRYVDAGFKVIIAHPERNPSVLKQPEVLRSLLTQDVFAQITAGSLTGDFGIDVQCCALYLLNNHLVDFLATDAHSCSYRTPVLSGAFRIAEKHIGYTEAVKLVRDNPRTVLADGNLTVSSARWDARAFSR